MMKNSRPFPARFESRCKDCKEIISEGQMIRYDDHNRIVHEDCEAVPQDDPLAATNPVCTNCWLTHPEGACDRE